MSKYTPLENWLRAQAPSSVVITFAQVERIISPNNLHSCARRHFRFWDNTPGASHNDAWLNASYKTVMVDMENERVKFQRVRGVRGA